MTERFCPRCGRRLSDNEHICPDCGHSDGTAPANVQVRVISGSTIRLNWATILLMLYGVIGVIEGVCAAFFSESIVDTLQSMLGTSFESLFGDMTRGEVIRMLTIEGYISLFSGVFAVIAGVCCMKRMNISFALACTLAASIMILTERIFYPMADMMMLIVQFLIGMLVFRMIHQSKDVFQN